MLIKSKFTKIYFITPPLIVCGVLVYLVFPSFFKLISNEIEYNSIVDNTESQSKNDEQEIEKEEEKKEDLPIPGSHIKNSRSG
jgi:hypothetical protein